MTPKLSNSFSHTVIIKSKDLLDRYYRETRGKTVLKISQFEMSKKFNDIETISRKEHEDGKN